MWNSPVQLSENRVILEFEGVCNLLTNLGHCLPFEMLTRDYWAFSGADRG